MSLVTREMALHSHTNRDTYNVNATSTSNPNSERRLADRGGTNQLARRDGSHTSEDEKSHSGPPSSYSGTRQNAGSDKGANGAADFFSPEVFQIVLHNPTTAHRLLKFSQARMCGENMEFLEKVRR